LHPQAIYWFSDKTCTTTEEIEAYFKHAWNVIKEEVYSATDVKWLTVDEKTATCLYTYHYEGYHNEKFVSGSGRATNIFTLVNDQCIPIQTSIATNKFSTGISSLSSIFYLMIYRFNLY